MRFLVLILFTGPLFAQSLSFGVKGGVPLTDAFSASQSSFRSYSSVTRRYTLGPTAEIGLPVFHLGLELDALYQRIGFDSSQAATNLLEPFQSTARIGAWNFDALLKHRWGGPAVHPYLAAGAAFRRFFTTRQKYVFPTPPVRYLSKQLIDEVNNKNIAGIAFSAGIEFGGALRVTPELRYTRWLMNNIHDSLPNLSTQANQAEFLLSFTFGRQ
ncbi:MAG TPA: outer membrane beta-barrel protein [Bryobacteraceae bacterium]|nr:outer membrane beta-barrel protein [Bryobacteraceae bacterium]